jgi:protein phosphatase
MRVACSTDRGRARSTNEDQVHADGQLGLLVVADGMGGHRGGEIASQLAVTTIVSKIANSLRNDMDHDDFARLIHQAVVAADDEIRRTAEERADLAGMGTTIVLALIQGGNVHIGHAGDSRAYLVHDNRIHRLTNDHSVAAEAEHSGRLLDKFLRRQWRNFITQSLGNQGSVTPTVRSVEWNVGDALVLCSDGLTNYVEDKTILKLVKRGATDLEKTCTDLIALANARGGHDNVSVVLARADEED